MYRVDGLLESAMPPGSGQIPHRNEMTRCVNFESRSDLLDAQVARCSKCGSLADIAPPFEGRLTK